MPGFCIDNNEKSVKLVNHLQSNCLQESLFWEEWHVERNTLDKFLEDKAFFDNENYLIVSEGVLLNKRELFGKYCASCVSDLMIKMRNSVGERFFSEFRGSFSGALLCKEENVWTVWTNHYGDNAVFFSSIGPKFVIGSQFNYVCDALKENGFECTVNEKAVLCMLTYGYMNEGITYANEISRLEPGHYLKIDGEGLHDLTYWTLGRTAYNLLDKSENEMVVEFDELFRRAVEREYSKDEEYGLRHLAELSGGLDSRMGVWIAHELGYRDIVCMNFCQSNYLDEKIAKEIAGDLGNEILLEPLDDASFLFDIDELVSENYGLALYSAITGCKRMLDNVNMQSFGLVHGGMVGDAILGSCLKAPENLHDTSPSGLYSTLLWHKIEPMSTRTKYEDEELYFLNVRGFLFAGTSNLYRQIYSESSSPFLDVDVLEYCMSMPIELRINHAFYRKWIETCYQKAGAYIWEKEGVPLTASSVKRLWIRALRKAKRELNRLGNGMNETGMNPFNRWLQDNPEIESYFDKYFETHIDNPVISRSLKNDISYAYRNETGQGKTQALTVLSAVKQYFPYR